MASTHKEAKSAKRSTRIRSGLRGIFSKLRGGTSSAEATGNEGSASPAASHSPLVVQSAHDSSNKPAHSDTVTGPNQSFHHSQSPDASTAVPANVPLEIPELPPSQIDELIGAYPRFRIVVIGKSGVGKSSLIQNIFNVKDIDVADGRAGEADIEREWTSQRNPRFILHDSKGFEPGSTDSWNAVKNFLRSRVRPDLDVSQRIHAVWFCMETPRSGGRLLQDGDERLITLSEELNIPIIAVFTKYNFLVNQYLAKVGMNQADRNVDPSAEAQRQASESFEKSVKNLQNRMKKQVHCVKLDKPSYDPYGTVSNLTTVTQSLLRDIEGELWIPWALAQQKNAHQKVELSIKECFQKYLHDTGVTATFEGRALLDCILRIHDDILKIWNFNDPGNILGGTRLFAQMIILAKIDGEGDHALLPEGSLAGLVDLTSLAANLPGAAILTPAFTAVGLSALAAEFLYGKYRHQAATTTILKGYIVNLVRLLHGVFSTILPKEPPRPLMEEIVYDELRNLKDKIRTDPEEFASNPDDVISFITFAR